MARLPQPGSDKGTWGDILNDFLSTAHNTDGSLKPIAPSGVAGLAPVATSGSFNDLQNKPTIPTTAADIGATTPADVDAKIAVQAGVDAGQYATQTALNTKAPLASPAFTGTATVGGATLAKITDITTAVSNLVTVGDGRSIGFDRPENHGAVGDGATDDTIALNAWLSSLATNGYVGVLGKKTYKATGALTCSAKAIRIQGAGAASSILSFSGTAYNFLTVGDGSGNMVMPTGYLRDFAVVGSSTAPVSGKAAVVINGLNQFEVNGVKVDNQDIGFDLINNCYGTQFTNIRGGFGGTVNVGVNLRVGSQSGSDILFVNPWINGRIAGVHCAGGGGGYHFYGGQITAGQGTSVANDSAGAIILGKDYLTSATGETSVDIHGTSFEGTTYAWIFRGFDQCALTAQGIYANPAVQATPAIGFLKHDNQKNSRFSFSGTTISGYYSAANLVSIAGSWGGIFWQETGTYSAAQGPTINGASVYVPSIIRQSSLQQSAYIVDNTGPSVGGLYLRSNNGALQSSSDASTWNTIGQSSLMLNLFTPNQSTAVTDATGMGSLSNCSVARDTTHVPQTGIDPAAYAFSSTAAGDVRGKLSAIAVTVGSTYTASALMISGVPTSSRSVAVQIDWLNSSSGYLSSTTYYTVTESPYIWTPVSVSGVAPAGAAFGQVNIFIASTAAAGEKHYVSRIALGQTG